MTSSFANMSAPDMEAAMTVMNADQQHDVVPQTRLDGGMPWDFSANVVDESFSFGIDNFPHGNTLVESPSNLNEEFEAFDDASEEGQLLAALSNEPSTLHNQQYCPATAVPTVDASTPRHLQTLSTPAVSFQDPWSIHRSQYPSDAAVPSVGFVDPANLHYFPAATPASFDHSNSTQHSQHSSISAGPSTGSGSYQEAQYPSDTVVHPTGYSTPQDPQFTSDTAGSSVCPKRKRKEPSHKKHIPDFTPTLPKGKRAKTEEEKEERERVKTLRNREAAERSRNKIKNEVTALRVECQQQKEQLEAQARHIAMLEQQLQQCGVHVSPFAGQGALDG